MLGAVFQRTFPAFLAGVAFASSALAAPLPQHAAQGDADAWRWRIAPYLWATDVEGSVSGAVLDVDLDVEFDDIVDNLGGAALLLVETGTDQFSLIGDFVYLDLELDGEGAAGAPASVDMQTYIVDIAGLHRIGPDSPLEFGGGVRYADFQHDLSVGPISDDADDDAFDGFIAARARWSLGPSWGLSVYGDVGAGDSDLTWQASAMLGWKTGGWGLDAGYRAISYDIESGLDEIDLTIHGLLLGIEFRI